MYKLKSFLNSEIMEKVAKPNDNSAEPTRTEGFLKDTDFSAVHFHSERKGEIKIIVRFVHQRIAKMYFDTFPYFNLNNFKRSGSLNGGC